MIEQEIRKDIYTALPNGTAIVKNTFWADFSIAEMDGVSGVRETYKRAFDEWKEDIRYMTALCITLNHKIWQRYEKFGESDELAKEYYKLWGKCDSYILDGEQKSGGFVYKNFTADEISYFLRATD